MNIFVTDESPIISAQNMCDVHVNKMLLESIQLLSTFLCLKNIKTQYKPTHIKHPCQIWLSNDISGKNVNWLTKHAFSLSNEFEYRKEKRHKCFYELLNIYDDLQKFILSDLKPDNFVQCMPQIFRSDNEIISYRNFYMSKMFTMKVNMKWSKRKQPEWFICNKHI